MCFLQIDSNFVFLSPPWIIHHSIDILDLENYVLSQANLSKTVYDLISI